MFGPQWWVRHVLAKHAADRPDLPGTGAELARHLLDEAGLQQVKVEQTDLGDHYDPDALAVRLTPPHHDGRSIAAVAVAAHEVSHAVQHARGEPAFTRRYQLVKNLTWIDRLASVILLLAPVVFAFVHVPALLILQILAGSAAARDPRRGACDDAAGRVRRELRQGAAGADARALSRRRRLPAARRVLKAAAYTYVAAALATLLDIARWFRMLRF